MPIYEYCCTTDGPFDVYRSVGTAPESIACPECGAPAVRIVSMPVLRRATQSAVFAAMEHAQKSAHEPDVVASVPRADRRSNRVLKVTPDLMRLPRR